jgi:hypothetical protein
MKMKIKNGTVFDGIIKIELKYRWRPIWESPDTHVSVFHISHKKSHSQQSH